MYKTKLKLNEIDDDRVKRKIIKERLDKYNYRITYDLNIPFPFMHYYAYHDKYNDLSIEKKIRLP
jgi:hypothetical protein